MIPLNAELLVLEQLGERDVRFIVSSLVADPDGQERVARLARTEPLALAAMLADTRVAARIITEADISQRISPYLLFAVLLRQLRRDLERDDVGPVAPAPWEQVPTPDRAALVAMVNNPEILHYLAEMLASFVRVEKAEQAPVPLNVEFSFVNAWNTNQLDVASLIRRGAESPHAQRLAVFRRIGDVALLMTGVFPDSMGQLGRIGWTEKVHANLRGVGEGHGRGRRRRRILAPAVEVEEIGRRYYRMAARHPNAGWLGWDVLLNHLAEKFSSVRTILNILSFLYLHNLRCNWLPGLELK